MNIHYGNVDANPDEVDRAAEAANVLAFATKLPEGLDHDVGPGGSQLSGGQKQRVAIARALLKDPRVLLMDEATSALDNETERVLQEAVNKVMAGRTSVVIAHRLSTVRNADQVVVMDAGTVQAVGTFAELADKAGGVFTHLVREQGLIAPARGAAA